MKLFRNLCALLVIVDILLAMAHLLWPEYTWGQGRRSYFNFDNSLTLASWLASMQLAALGTGTLIAYLRDTYGGHRSPFWIVFSLLAFILSLAEMTRFPWKLEIVRDDTIYHTLAYFSFVTIFLSVLCTQLYGRLRHMRWPGTWCIAWIACWSCALALSIISSSLQIPSQWDIFISLARGVCYLLGITFLFSAVGEYVLTPREYADILPLPPSARISLPVRSGTRWRLLAGVAGTTFTVIVLQILLNRVLTIFSDYLTAFSIISIALLGLSIGGVIGYYAAQREPLKTMALAALVAPLSILFACAVGVAYTHTPLFASMLLTFPFIACGVIITITLIILESHLVYCMDLLGAALGVLLVNPLLVCFREEGSFLVLAGFSFVISSLFIHTLPAHRFKTMGASLAAICGAVLIIGGTITPAHDVMNIVTAKITRSYPSAKVLFSRSTMAGRYDIIRRKPHHKTVSAYDNGRIIDTVRRLAPSHYRVDPRLPHTLIEDPTILILGLSGDGVTKTARTLGKRVYGVEINPAVVHLQRNELVPYNADSYNDIDVSVMDGRTYLEMSRDRYDIITLLNTHSARGKSAGRSPSPEYLHTEESIAACLDHLTDRGIIVYEEPVNRPNREPPVWKLLLSMRSALLKRGQASPERHFFIFQWKTTRNNYMQIVLKKNPLTSTDINKLKRWLYDVEHLRTMEKKEGTRLGPIRSARITLLYSPDGDYPNNYGRIVEGNTSAALRATHNLTVTTDNRPFHFDVDPGRHAIQGAFTGVLVMALPLLALFFFLMRPRRNSLGRVYSPLLVVTLTGIAYFLLEIVLMQRYQLFLGSPIVAFAAVLGSFLFFSGLGSLWSGHVKENGIAASLLCILVAILFHAWGMPALFHKAAALPLSIKLVITVITVAPLAFFIGVPFPYALRTSKDTISPHIVALLFAVNTVAGAVVIPLSLYLSTAFGFHMALYAGFLLYIALSAVMIADIPPLSQHGFYRHLAQSVASLVIAALMLVPLYPMAKDTGADASSAPLYKVYGASYGRSTYTASNLFLDGSSRERRSFQWLFWIVRGEGKTILVDTGFDDASLADRWRIRNYVSPLQRLAGMAISPDEISDIIITHAHWDHIGSLAPFTRARLWMQNEEYMHAQSTVSLEKPVRKGMRLRDISLMQRAQREGRLRLLGGNATIIPGISVHLCGGHTPGSQYVSVNTRTGPVIISGDECYLYENNQKTLPIGSAYDHDRNLSCIKEMQRRAASPFYILPGHDPKVIKWFSEAADGVVYISALPERDNR